MKKFILFIFTFFLAIEAFSFNSDNIRFLTFENGLKLYLIEDFSSAVVRMEIKVNAGYTSQTEENAGYFPFYARLKNATITADCVSNEIICAPSDCEKSIKELSTLLIPLSITDKNLKNEVNFEYENLKSYTNSLAGFINAAIETRVYPQNPWKRESSANPEIFIKNSLSETRSILNYIAKNYYTPENTTLYVSGNITANSVETFVKRAFERFPNSTSQKEKSKIESKINFDKKQTKFILTDSEFSDEITQIAIQYTNLSQIECDICSKIMNENFSNFKKSLLNDKTLGIISPEYINVAATQKSDTVRLIIQSILSKNKESVPNQVKSFLDKLKNTSFNRNDFNYEIEKYSNAFQKDCDSSTQVMKLLKDFSLVYKDENTHNALFEQSSNLKKVNIELASKKIATENPFVFIFLNSKTYKKYEKEFKEQGFVEISKKNGVWFKQDSYLSLMKANAEKTNANKMEETAISQTETESFESAKRFVENNKCDFYTFTLSNKIPVALKHTNTNLSNLTITIDGGDLLFAKDFPGLTAVIVDSIAINIRNKLDTMYQNGYTKEIYDVYAKTENTHSTISISFLTEDFHQVIKSITDVLIYEDITPALADGICYDERTQWRIKTGSSEFQMLSYAIREFYKKQDLALLYDDSKDKPVELQFSNITENYVKLLDSSRYSIVIVGNFTPNSDFVLSLNNTFGDLASNKISKSTKTEINEPNVANFEKRIQLKHLFFTDENADKNRTRPAILIPTTKFLDPILYITKNPNISSIDSAYFNAITLELCRRIEEKAQKIEEKTKVRYSPASKDLPFAQIFVTNVEKTSSIDKIFKDTIKELKNDLAAIINEEIEISESEIKLIDMEKPKLISQIENNWVMENLKDCSVNETATLIQKSFLIGKPNFYLEQYSAINNATAADYYLVLSKYLNDLPSIRIYSVDSKK